MKIVEVYDIETIINCFTYCGLNVQTMEESQFVIHNERNDLLIFIEHLNKLDGQIGFNNLGFDGQVIQFILDNYKTWVNKSGEEVSGIISAYANKVIEKLNKGSGQWSDYPEWKMKIPQCDLFKIFHFDNKAKMTSLKWIEFMLDMHSIEEMPIHHMTNVTLEQINNLILPYNKHDVKATYELYKIAIGNTSHPLYKGVDKIKLRKDIQKEFDIKCINYNDVKIGDELNKISYCRLKRIDKKSIPQPIKPIPSFLFKDCFPSYYKFETLEFNNFINAIANIPVNLKKVSKSTDNKKNKQNFEFTYNNTVYTIAKGGLHSNDEPRIVIPKENEILRDADVGGMYPRAIDKRGLFPRHLGIEWLIGFRNTINARAIAKKKFKETKEGKYQSIQETYKLSNNGGGFGKTNEEFSWQYDPKVTMDTTIGSQIDLLMLIEDLEIENIHVISANTDGIVCLFDKSKEEDYYRICKNWEKQVGNDVSGNLEYVDYKLLAQTSVNDYLAIKTNGDVKTKGDFSSEYELHKNKSSRIIPIALQNYFVNNVSVKETIINHNNIFDFCIGCKSIGKNRLLAIDVKKQTEIELQKINRYYISNSGVNIIKRLPKLEKKVLSGQIDIFGQISDDSREQELEAGWLSTIYNKHIIKNNIKEYDINYNYYIKACEKIINQIERKN